MTESKQILTEVERKTLTTSEGRGLKAVGNISPGPPTVRSFSAGSNSSPKAARQETEGLSTWTALLPTHRQGLRKESVSSLASQRLHTWGTSKRFLVCVWSECCFPYPHLKKNYEHISQKNHSIFIHGKMIEATGGNKR